MKTITDSTTDSITAVILAGGRARRMGGQDKGLLKVNGIPMVDYIVQALRPQVHTLLINANRNLDQYSAICQCRTVADMIDGYAGPLAGMASAMETIQSPLLLTVPCDSPCLAHNYALRMHQVLLNHNAEICVARDDHRIQPVFALLRSTLLPSLRNYLQQGNHKIDLWYAQHLMVEVDFSDCPEMFFNVNTPAEHLALEQRLRDAENANQSPTANNCAC